MKDPIERQDVIDAFDCTDELIVSGSANAQNVMNYINKVIGKIKALPSAQPDVPDIDDGDMISRQAAVLQLSHNKSMGDEEWRLAVENDIRTLWKLPSEQRWIPCSERLPEDDTEVFVYLFDHPSPYIAWVCDGCWFTEEFQVEKENYPKAWMPLPKPYAERREE